MSNVVRVVETLVGRPTPIGATSAGPVTSAIVKVPVTGPSLELGEINLVGDDQADRTVHGGPDKSVYCYPSEHAAAWRADGFDLPPGSVGENVVLEGIVEHEARVGDVWRWGSALVQISQPRAPCFKLALRTGRKEIAAHMIASGRSGWYLRTIEPGTVETAGAWELVERRDGWPTVADTFAAMFTGRRAEAADAGLVARVVACAALAPEWLGYLTSRNPIAGG
jgi:MOSC domain-containing protein YiiM